MTATIVMVVGVLHARPITKTTKSGHSVQFFKLKIPRGPSFEWWMCSVFSPAAREELEAFDAGDPISVVGSLNLELYVFEGKTRINREVSVSRIIGIKRPDKARRDAEKANISEEIPSIDSNEPDNVGGLPAWIARTSN